MFTSVKCPPSQKFLFDCLPRWVGELMGLKWFLIDYHYNCDTTKLQSKFFRLYYFVYKTQICFAAPNKNISFDSTVCWPLIYTDHLSLLTSSFWCESGLHAAYKTNTKNASSYMCLYKQYIVLKCSYKLALLLSLKQGNTFMHVLCHEQY